LQTETGKAEAIAAATSLTISLHSYRHPLGSSVASLVDHLAAANRQLAFVDKQLSEAELVRVATTALAEHKIYDHVLMNASSKRNSGRAYGYEQLQNELTNIEHAESMKATAKHQQDAVFAKMRELSRQEGYEKGKAEALVYFKTMDASIGQNPMDTSSGQNKRKRLPVPPKDRQPPPFFGLDQQQRTALFATHREFRKQFNYYAPTRGNAMELGNKVLRLPRAEQDAVTTLVRAVEEKYADAVRTRSQPPGYYEEILAIWNGALL